MCPKAKDNIQINTEQASRLNKHIKMLMAIALLMFGFTFALIPFYNVFCKVTGLNGKIELNKVQLAKNSEIIDTARFINVQLTANKDANIQVEFEAQHKYFRFHPGEFVQANFRVKNLTNHDMSVQAIPSVTPGQGAKHVKKIVCFCFTQQKLKPNQEMIMPLRFTVAPQIPKRYQTITLSYTLFDVTKR